MSQLFAGFFLLISTLFSCQQPKADFKSLSVADFDSFIKADDVQRLMFVRWPSIRKAISRER